MRSGGASEVFVGLACGLGATDDRTGKKIIVIAGQSNAKGEDALVSGITSVTGLDAAYPNVTLRQKLTDVASDPLVWTYDQTVPTGPRPDGKFGIDLSLARYLDRTAPNNWAIVKFAVPSTSLGQNWRTDVAFPVSGPNLFNQLLTYMRGAETSLGGKVAAIIWIQGETDAGGPTLASAYETNLTNLIAGIRAQFPALPFYYNRLSSSYVASDTTTVRTAQTNVDTNVTGTTMIDVDDLALVGAHFTADSYVALGNRFAKSFLLASGYKIPPIAAFTFVAVNLQVTFTDGSTDDDGTVVSRSWAFGDGATSSSTNPVRTYATAGTYTVTLTVVDSDGRSASVSKAVTVTVASVTVDATSGRSVPQDATEWTTLIASASLATGVPDHLYLCQETSGDLVDAIGGVNITAVNTPLYQQTVTGWSRKGVGWTEGGTGRFQRTTTFAAPSAEAYFFLAYYAQTTVPAAARFVIGVGTSASAAIRTLTTGKYDAAAAGNVAAGAVAAGTSVRPVVLLADSVNNVTIGATESETMTPTHGDAGTAGVYVPSSGTTPGGQLVYLAIWRGTKAEAFTRTRIKALQEALGWTVGWTP